MYNPSSPSLLFAQKKNLCHTVDTTTQALSMGGTCLRKIHPPITTSRRIHEVDRSLEGLCCTSSLERRSRAPRPLKNRGPYISVAFISDCCPVINSFATRKNPSRPHSFSLPPLLMCTGCQNNGRLDMTIQQWQLPESLSTISGTVSRRAPCKSRDPLHAKRMFCQLLRNHQISTK